MMRVGARYDLKPLDAWVNSVDKALVRLENMTNGIAQSGAAMYVQELINAIHDQRYAATYVPYSTSYSEKKKRMVSHLDFWILTGDVVRAIEIVPGGPGTAFAGLDPRGAAGAAGGEHGKSIAFYAFVNEYGTRLQYGAKNHFVRLLPGDVGHGPAVPARPVFRPTAMLMVPQIKEMIEGEMLQALREIINAPV